jgi:cytochrome c peroxidase
MAHINALACASVGAFLAALAVAAWGAEFAVGPGDVREGYESRDYRSQSEMLETRLGDALPLAELAASPPLGLPPLSSVPSSEEVELGRRLFFDRRLSANATLSCGMCHIPEQGFAQNELATPVGIEGRSVRRNAPALYNVAYVSSLFLDGREPDLVNQIWGPLLANNEMGNSDRAAVLARVAAVEDYAGRFAALYSQGLTEHTLGMALASYEIALLSASSPFDRWYFSADSSSIVAIAIEGFEVFKRSGCASCHVVDAGHALFTDGGFHNTGAGYLRHNRSLQPARVQLAPGVFVEPTVAVEILVMADDGRFEVTRNSVDRWRYRTPSLRNVAVTGPYLHDGSLGNLDAVLEFYNSGGGGDPQQDPRVRPLNLSKQDMAALKAFLEALTGDNVDALAADARSTNIGDAGKTSDAELFQ